VTEARGSRWLLLIHQIPPRPAYLRVKIGRRLQALGAVAVKNSVYVLPLGAQALEDFHWVRSEIVAGGGDASVCHAGFQEGLTDQAVESLFDAARDADYAGLARELRLLQQTLGRGKRPPLARERAVAAASRLRKRFEDVAAVDFFRAARRDEVEGLLAAVELALRPAPDATPERVRALPRKGRTWVTRGGVYVDRMASAWLIRRFIDAKARFRFVRGEPGKPKPGEVRFDMFEAEFTHRGDLCTFEVLVHDFRLDDPALRHISEIVHDIDLKDAKFARAEAPGLERLLAGIALRRREDLARIDDGALVFDALYESFRRKK